MKYSNIKCFQKIKHCNCKGGRNNFEYCQHPDSLISRKAKNADIGDHGYKEESIIQKTKAVWFIFDVPLLHIIW